MRVGLVCPYDMSQPGGVQEQVRGLQNALVEWGDEAIVLAPGAGPGADMVDLGSTMSIRANRSRVPVSAHPGVGRRIRSAVSDLDVVHVHEPLMPTVSLAALRCGRPVVATFHANPGPMATRLYRLLDGRLRSVLGNGVRAITAVSATAASAIPGNLPISIVPNGIDLATFSGVSAPVPGRVCFLGRDEPRKGLGVLLEGWRRVQASLPEASLVVMGARRDISGVEWLGRVDDTKKVEVLGSSSVFVAPHLGGESFGIVLVEAMASGTAVLASDLEPFKEVAGTAAMYFRAGDSAHLAEQLLRLLGDERTRRDLGSAGRARARNFGWETVAASYRDVYLQALS